MREHHPRFEIFTCLALHHSRSSRTWELFSWKPIPGAQGPWGVSSVDLANGVWEPSTTDDESEEFAWFPFGIRRQK